MVLGGPRLCSCGVTNYRLHLYLHVCMLYNYIFQAKIMFDGEFLGLQKILETKTLYVPQPHKVCKFSFYSLFLIQFQILAHPEGKGWVFIMEYIEMKPLRTQMKRLGEQLARQQMYNCRVYMYIRTCIYMDICTHSTMYVFTCTYVHMYTMYMYVYLHVSVCTCTY